MRLEIEILEKMHRIHFKEFEEDKWEWSRNGYSVKEAYSSAIFNINNQNTARKIHIFI